MCRRQQFHKKNISAAGDAIVIDHDLQEEEEEEEEEEKKKSTTTTTTIVMAVTAVPSGATTLTLRLCQQRVRAPPAHVYRVSEAATN
jgi:hypothetical protein